MAGRLDYRPNLERDPKKVLDASRERLAEIIAENTIRNELKNVDITKITKDDILKFADYAFKNPPTYSIVASQDTLDNNKEFLESLK